jgi:hypothetical protein
MYILTALDKEGNRYWYTGCAGDSWLSTKRHRAFEYESHGAAQHKATLFNRQERIHGYWFVPVLKSDVVSV